MKKINKFIDAAIFIAVELNDPANMDDETSISWWNAGSMDCQLFYNNDKLSVGLNLDVPKANAKYYSIYGYCAIHGITFIEMCNKN